MLDKMRGEITVFLTLVLVLILALVGTMIEAVRINVARVVVERTLDTAIDSSASEYSVPLLDEYHLVLLDTGYDSDKANEEKMLNDITKSMEYTFQPTKGLSLFGTSIPLSNQNLLKIKTGDINILDKTSILDYNGTLFMNQAIQYEKYKDLSSLMEELLNKLKLLQSTKISATVIKEKLKVDEKMMELDKYNMELMELIDGIDFNKYGLQLVSSGMIKTKDVFIKMIVNVDPSPTEVGINHSVVFSSLSSKYINIQKVFQIILDNLEQFKKLIADIKELEEDLKTLIQSRDSLSKERENNKDPQEGSNEESENDKALKELDEQIQDLQDKIDELEDEKKELINEVNKNIKKINDRKEGILEKIVEALKVIEKIEDKKPGILESINNYKEKLNNNKEELATDYYNNLKDELKNTEDYFSSENDAGNQSNHTDVTTMKKLLIENQSILNHKSLQKVQDESTEAISALIKEVSNLQMSYQSYHTQSLKFDYSGVVLDSDVENPVTNLYDLISNGVLTLIVDDVNTISDATLKEDSLYNQYANTQNTSSNENNSGTAANLQSSYETKTIKDVGSLYEDYESSSDAISILSDKTSTVLNELLFNQYILRHFKSMKSIVSNKEETKEQKSGEDEKNNITNKEVNDNLDSEYVKTLESVLKYEQEYIIIGNKNDKQNLTSIVNRLMAIRTILNFIYLMGDKEKVGEANATALALVGFTGLSALVQFTKMLILLTWSFNESLVDVRALICGKSVPLLKTKETFQLKYSDLLSVNKEFIKKKADSIKSENASLGFDYDDYISIFLLLTADSKKSYRSMDLIQANINLRYKGGVALENCLYGFKIRTKMKMDSLFIKLPFVNNLINHNIKNYFFEVESDYTY